MDFDWINSLILQGVFLVTGLAYATVRAASLASTRPSQIGGDDLACRIQSLPPMA